ncbi:MAG: hypothetical protein P8Y97_18395 [Candidatus Lokiarchaeota archaeon]
MFKMKSYRRLAQFIILLGGLLSLLFCYNNFSQIADVVKWIKVHGLADILRYFIGMICSGMTLLLGGKPNNPIPFRSFFILLLGFMYFILAIYLGGIIVLIGGFLNLIDNQKEDTHYL